MVLNLLFCLTPVEARRRQLEITQRFGHDEASESAKACAALRFSVAAAWLLPALPCSRV
jgi:hypothetical protein